MSLRKVVVFIGSTRDGRFGEKVANYVKKTLEKNGFQCQIFDPLLMDFPVIRQPLHFMKDRSSAPAWLIEADQTIRQADGFVIVSSEYNASIPPALTNMMDHFPPASYRHRPCSIISYSMGEMGAFRVHSTLQPFISELGMISLPSRALLPVVHTKFDADGTTNCEKFRSSVEKIAKELAWYVDALQNQKKSSGVPN